MLGADSDTLGDFLYKQREGRSEGTGSRFIQCEPLIPIFLSQGSKDFFSKAVLDRHSTSNFVFIISSQKSAYWSSLQE